jgi:hypothetical protein
MCLAIHPSQWFSSVPIFQPKLDICCGELWSIYSERERERKRQREEEQEREVKKNNSFVV